MSDAANPPIEVPYGALPPETLRRVIESFVLREGTDYGPREFSLEEKVSHVLRQLERGEAHVLFDPETESVQLLISTELRHRRRGGLG